MTPQYSWTLTRDEPARFFAAFAFLAASKHASLKDEGLAFIAQYEKLSGKTLPSGHVWKTGKADEAS